MARKKAMLILNPARRAAQLAFLSGRAEVLFTLGDLLWASLEENQVPRLIAQGIAVQIDPLADLVQVPAVVFDPLVSEPDPPPDLTAESGPPLVAVAGTETVTSFDEPATEDQRPYQLVQFIGPIQPEWIDEIADVGGEHVQSLPGNVAVFRLDQSQVGAARELRFVRWVGLYHPAYALRHELAGRAEPFDAASLSSLTIDPSQLPELEEGNILISFFPDVDLTALIGEDGSPVEGGIPVDTGLHITTIAVQGVIARADGPDVVRRLLRVPGVFAVEPFRPPELDMDRAGVISFTNQVRDFGHTEFNMNLDGAGEIVGILDTGLDTGNPAAIHADLSAPAGGSRVLYTWNTASNAIANDANGHGTHVAGIIAGNGSQTGGRIRGIAPAAQIIMHSPPGASSLGGIINAHVGGARVHSNSWGSPAGITNNPYNGTTTTVDILGWLFPDSLIVFSAGNDEQDTQPAGGDGALDMNRLRVEKQAKNILLVGASENLRNNNGIAANYQAWLGVYPNGALPLNAVANGGAFSISDNANEIGLFSCRGLVGAAAGGRVRPDIAAPGTNIVSLRSSVLAAALSASEIPAFLGAAAIFYQISTGTSMAAPHVSGAALLARQFFRTRFGQFGRPVALQITPIPAAPPPPAFVDRPAAALTAAEVVLAWIAPKPAGTQRDIIGTRYQRTLTAITPAPVTLAANVGNHSAPAVARHGTATLLLFRDRNTRVQLKRLRPDLTPDPAFNANVLNAATRADDTLPPALLVAGDHVAVVWADATTQAINFQRFNATTGAKIDAAPLVLGNGSELGPHTAIAWSGTSYAIAWVDTTGAQPILSLRMVNSAGQLAPANAPLAVHQQAQSIRGAHITWCPAPAPGRFAIVWADGRTRDNSEIFLRFVNPNAQVAGAAVRLFGLPAAPPPPLPVLRRPHLSVRNGGFFLRWESDLQHAGFDLYQLQTDANGAPDAVSLRAISDIPTITSGFACVSDAGGAALIWQGAEQDVADRLTLYALNLSPQGAALIEQNPGTPQILAGRYVPHTLHDPSSVEMPHVAIAWAGGTYFLLRTVPAGLIPTLQLVHTNADGVPGSVRQLFPAPGFGIRAYECDWIDDGRLACIGVETFLGRTVSIALCDGKGDPVPTFGTNGVAQINETQDLSDSVSPQIAHRGAPVRLCAVYGRRRAGGGATLRLATLNEAGAVTGGPRNLADVDGTARHGWFHTVPSGLIAVWHVRPNANSANIAIRLFRPDGTPIAPAPPQLTQGLAGESLNATIAPRPRRGNSAQREYAVVWQHRAAAAQPWRILFSRVDRQGRTIVQSPDGPATGPNVISTRHFVIAAPPAGAGDAPAEGWGAVHPQIVSTFTHEPPGAPVPAALPALALPLPPPLLPQPGYGCAWLEYISAGPAEQIGKRVLRFVALDENGRPITTQRSPFAGVALPTVQVAPITVSDPTANVEDYRLIWNGRSFRLTWTEQSGGTVRHRQTTLTRHGSTLVYAQPSSALLRATLINGATNIDRTALPNLNSPAGPPAPPSGLGGYGWGRVNLRQALALPDPVAFHVRDDNAVGPGRSVTYQFTLPRGIALLRVTLCWNDLPGAALQNILRLRVVAPDTREYFGNSWQAARPDLTQPNPANAAVAAEGIHTTQQVVIENPVMGDYGVEVLATIVRMDNVSQFRAQPFALVFVGSGPEIRFRAPGAGAGGGYIY